jgi:ParB-like chromosome segregation protein Spo0J
MSAANTTDTPSTQPLPLHPLAENFPPLEGTDFEELVADIKQHGLNEPIVVFEGKILDGRNRARACEKAGVEPRYTPFKGDTKDATAFVISANVHRWHLTPKQKRERIAKLIKAAPEKSNNTIAKQVKVDDKTVAKVRRGLEATSEIPKLGKTVGADGKARKQPAKKKRRTVARGSNRLLRLFQAPGEHPAVTAPAASTDTCIAEVETIVRAALASQNSNKDRHALLDRLMKLLGNLCDDIKRDQCAATDMRLAP